MIYQLFKKLLLKAACLTLSLQASYGAEYLQRSSQGYPTHGLKKTAMDIITRERHAKDHAVSWKLTGNVVRMFPKDVQLPVIPCTLKTDSIVLEVNASYNHSTQTLELPYVLRSNGTLYATCRDQGIVSHEVGHMILNWLKQFRYTTHTAALHEAFGDLTAHFFRYHNPRTRQKFLEKLTYNEGCVGDAPFSCTRNSSQPLKLLDVAKNNTLCESHDFSKPFTTAVYGNMQTEYQNRGFFSSTFTWGESEAGSIVAWHRRTLVDAILSLETAAPTLMDVAKQMLVVTLENSLYRDGLGKSFIQNGLVVLMYREPSHGQYETNKKYTLLCLPKKKENTFRILHSK